MNQQTIRVLHQLKGRILCILTFLLTTCHGQNQPATNNVLLLVKTCDITNRGAQDTVTLKIDTTNWNAPIVWDLSVFSKSKVPFNYHSNDAWLDSNLHSQGFVVGCPTYISCKKKYYEKMILESSIQKLGDAVDLPQAHNARMTSPAYSAVLRFYTDSLHFSKENAKKSAETLVNSLRPDMLVLVIPESPVQSRPPLVYDQANSIFVPIWTAE